MDAAATVGGRNDFFANNETHISTSLGMPVRLQDAFDTSNLCSSYHITYLHQDCAARLEYEEDEDFEMEICTEIEKAVINSV